MAKNTIGQGTKENHLYSWTVKDYQQQIIQPYRNIANNYLESQNQIIDSLQLSWSPIIYNIYGKSGFWTYYWWWIYPLKIMSDAHRRIINNSFRI